MFLSGKARIKVFTFKWFKVVVFKALVYMCDVIGRILILYLLFFHQKLNYDLVNMMTMVVLWHEVAVLGRSRRR